MDLQGELNRLVGQPPEDRRGAAWCANAWAGTTGLELVGALNVKAGIVPNGSCLELNAVLRRLGLAGYDQGGFTVGVDAGGIGADADGEFLLQNTLRLPGISGNYLSTPDTAAISVTGDIDIRVKVAADDWLQIGKYLVYKRGTNSGYGLRTHSATAGRLEFIWGDGTANVFVISTAAVPFAAGQAGWVRATLDVDNGAAGRDVKFYTSDDGVAWTQLGTTQTTAGLTSIADTTQILNVGVDGSGTNGLAGHYYYAEVRSGIAGPVVAKFDSSTVAVRGDRLPTTFTDPDILTPWTANGSDWWWGTYTGTQRYTYGIQLDEQYVYFPGTSGNYASTPDSAALSVVGDIDIRAKIAPDVWASGNSQEIVSKWSSAQSYQLILTPTGQLRFVWSADGTTTAGDITGGDLSALGNGSTQWVRSTLDVDNGSSQKVVTFYRSSDGVTWTQIGISTTAGTTSIADSTTQVEIGSRVGGAQNLFAGKVYYAEIRNSIGGTVQGSFDPYRAKTTAVRSPGSFSAGGGGAPTWTLNGTAWEWGTQPTKKITAPDSAALSITGDIDIRVKASMTNWRGMATQTLISKRTGATGGYTLRTIQDSVELGWGEGATSRFVSADQSLPFTAGATGWIRATLDVDNGSGGHAVNFYTSSDGVTWTQLGTANRTAGAFTTNIGDDAVALEIGSAVDSILNMNGGTIHYAEVRNGIGGTVVGSFNPNVLRYPSGQSPTTLKSATGETYTISGSGWRWVEI